MTVGWLDPSTENPTPGDSQVARLDELALGIRDRAVAQARARQAPAALAEVAASPEFAVHFVRGLARGVAQTLADHDQRVQVVYAYEFWPDRAQPGAQSGALAHLLVLVTAPSAALEALVLSLNRGLAASLQALPWPWGSRTGLPLEISIVTEQEAQRGAGVARLLSAARPAPMKLWQRCAEPRLAGRTA